MQPYNPLKGMYIYIYIRPAFPHSLLRTSQLFLVEYTITGMFTLILTALNRDHSTTVPPY